LRSIAAKYQNDAACIHLNREHCPEISLEIGIFGSSSRTIQRMNSLFMNKTIVQETAVMLTLAANGFG
jgi:hypothetical protein